MKVVVVVQSHLSANIKNTLHLTSARDEQHVLAVLRVNTL